MDSDTLFDDDGEPLVPVVNTPMKMFTPITSI